MPFRMAFKEAESGGELSLQCFCVVAHNIQTAASGRTIRSEGTEKEMSAGLYRRDGLFNVIHALTGVG
jgi:hypothetical protein